MHVYPDFIAEKGVAFIKEYYSMNWTLMRGTMADVLESMNAGGVDMGVALSVATRPDQVVSINNWLSGQLSDRVIGFGSIHAGYSDNAGELERFGKLGLSGVKLHPDMQMFDIDDKRMFPAYERAAELGLPILFHMGDERSDRSSPKRLARVLDALPQLTAIAAHLGGYSCWDEAKEYLGGRENVYYDTSSTLRYISAQRAVDIIRHHGVDRVLFATDYPVTSHKDEIERFMSLQLTDDEREQIFSKNAKRLLGI